MGDSEFPAEFRHRLAGQSPRHKLKPFVQPDGSTAFWARDDEGCPASRTEFAACAIIGTTFSYSAYCLTLVVMVLSGKVVPSFS
jgi:hypothetical protein